MLALFQTAWDIYLPHVAPDGIDRLVALTGWLLRQRATLINQNGCDHELDLLVRAGCHPEMLLLMVGLLHRSSRLAGFRNVLFGSPRRRQRVIRSLDRAARGLSEIFPPEFEDRKAAEEVEKLGQVPPGQVIAQVSKYRDFLRFVDSMPQVTGVRSIEEAVRFLLCAYVEQATGRPHNAEVSALIGCALDCAGDEVAHGMWRLRNYQRLEKAFEPIRPFLLPLAETLHRNLA